MSDLVDKLREAIQDDLRIARAAAEHCGCHAPSPVWTFVEDGEDERMVIEDDPHPQIRKQLTRKWSRTYQDLFAGRHIAHFDPDRAIRQAEAFLEIVDLYEGTSRIAWDREVKPRDVLDAQREECALKVVIEALAKVYQIEVDQ